MSPKKPSCFGLDYDKNIQKMLPNYIQFHQAVIDLIQTYTPSPENWLDTGCGTGNLAACLLPLFPKTTFVLADPSSEMIAATKEKIKSKDVTFVFGGSQELEFEDDTFDVITAVLSHHYLSKEERQKAVANCFRMLKKNGIFVYFEHIRPFSEKGIEIALHRWYNYQIANGRTQEEVAQHLSRLGKEYFPITVADHLDLLKQTGFDCVEILWVSFIQGGFYAIK
ncbi:MAG: methyltransferase domain-containing protein [Methanimicrococcus sp.]|nr:methyltransferase domain-containing protein [Methanimicrococcus sp.]